VSCQPLAVSRQLKALNDSGRQGVILSGSEGSIPVMRKTVSCHSERKRRIYARGEESHKTSFSITDSSLCVTIPFPVFPSRHFCHRLEWR